MTLPTSIFSDERVDGIADMIIKELSRKGMMNKDAKAFQMKTEIKKAYVKFYKINEEVGSIVKKRISSMAKPSEPGTSAFQILFEKQFIEEWKKH